MIKNSVIDSYSKILKNDNDYDWSYMLKLEQFKLNRMKNYFECHSVTRDRKKVVSNLNICIKLISIVLEEDLPGYFFNNTRILPYINDRNYKRFIRHYVKGNEYSLNALRQQKALCLYNLIRSYKMETWWD